MKVWITKYALTQGIYSYGYATVCNATGTMIEVVNKTGFGHNYYHKPDWHETEEEAIARAEEMRLKKIKSLEKQLAKFKEMKFT